MISNPILLNISLCLTLTSVKKIKILYLTYSKEISAKEKLISFLLIFKNSFYAPQSNFYQITELIFVIKIVKTLAFLLLKLGSSKDFVCVSLYVIFINKLVKVLNYLAF